MVDSSVIGSVTQYNPQAVQGVANSIFYVLAGLIAGGILLFILYKIYQRFTYNYTVTVIEKVGSGDIQYTTKAKEVKDSANNHMLHYLGIGYSQRWTEFADYLRSVKGTMLGIFPTVSKGFTIYKIGQKIIPVKVQSNPGLIPIDYDMFNYMQWKVIEIRTKYTKEDKLRQMLPIIALGMVVLAFILGSYFWSKHVENVAAMMLSKAADIATKYSGAQIITPT